MIGELCDRLGLGYGLNGIHLLIAATLLSGGGVAGGAWLWTYKGKDIAFDLPANSRFAQAPGDRIAQASRWLGSRDTLSINALSDEADNLSLTVDVVSPGSGGTLDRDFVAALRSLPGSYQFRHAADGYRYTLRTRWGRLAGRGFVATSDAFRKNCLLFVSQYATRAVAMYGHACASPGRDVSPAEIACLIDGLAMRRLPEEPDAQAFLAAHAAQPATCASDIVARPEVWSPFRSRPLSNVYRTREERLRGW